MIFTHFQTFLIYLFAVLFLSFFLMKYQKRSNIAYILIAIIPLLIISFLRKNVGTDYSNYRNIYENYKNIGVLTILTNNNFEFGYYLINRLGYMFGSFNVTLLIASFLTIFIPIFTVRNNEKISLPIFGILYSLAFYIPSFNFIRQGIAIAISFYGIYQLINNKHRKAMILSILIASTFHMTAFFLLFIVFLVGKNYKFNKSMAIILGLLSFILVLNLEVIFDLLSNIPFLSKYILYDQIREANNYTFYLVLVMYILLLLIRKKIYELDNITRILLFFVFMDVVLTFTGFNMVFIKRIALYFDVYLVLLLSLLPRLFVKSERNVIKTLIFLYGVFIFVYSFWIIGHSQIFPYQI